MVYYGDYLRKMNFEIQPLLTKIFTEEFSKNNAGSKIKNPLEYSLQLISELHIKFQDPKILIAFLKDQGMDLFNQPNVKGWPGGHSWLTSQLYTQRLNVADLFSNGRSINGKVKKTGDVNNKKEFEKLDIRLDWNKKGNNKAIIAELADRLLFQVDDTTQKDFEAILKYDFDPNAKSANQAVLRLFNAMTKMPEYQLI